jgi:mannitol-1-phosphate/altronate dehydrogenase
MELKELQHSDVIALVGVMERVVMADKLLNEQEEEFVRWLMESVGKERYIDALDEFDSQYGDEDLRSLLESITDPTVREILYGTVLEASTINALVGENTEFMDWLATLWNLEIRIEENSADHHA